MCAQGNLIEEPYTDGALIIKEGEAGESMYLLKSGSASATKAGFDFEIEYMPGDFFGELALLTASPRGAVSAPSRPPHHNTESYTEHPMYPVPLWDN